MTRFSMSSEPEHFTSVHAFVRVRRSLTNPPRTPAKPASSIDPDALEELVEEDHPTIEVHLSRTSYEATVEVHRRGPGDRP